MDQSTNNMGQKPVNPGGSDKKMLAALIIIAVALVIALGAKHYFSTRPISRSKPTVANSTSTPAFVDPAACPPSGTVTNLAQVQIPSTTTASVQVCNVNLVDSKMAAFPDISQFTGLKRVNLSYNQITTVPAQIGTLSQLIVLDLSNNKISQLPTEMGSLNNLTALDVSNNQLSGLPESFSGLAKLTQLNLDNNKFTTLPAVVTQIPGLVELDLSGNQLTQLPSGLQNLKHLYILTIAGNKISSKNLAALQALLPKVKIVSK